jgi:hypothetical protein
MSKCAVCKTQERTWTWQPWGPGEGSVFTLPGSHYRGFAAIPVCDGCKQDIDAGQSVTFTYRRHQHTVAA